MENASSLVYLKKNWKKDQEEDDDGYASINSDELNKSFNSSAEDEDDDMDVDMGADMEEEEDMLCELEDSEPIQEELISPKKLLSFIDTLKPENKENREE